MQSQNQSISNQKTIKAYFSNSNNKDRPKLLNPTINKSQINNRITSIKEEDLEDSKEFQPKEKSNNININKKLTHNQKSSIFPSTDCSSLIHNSSPISNKKKRQDNRNNIKKNNEKRTYTPKSNLINKKVNKSTEKKEYLKTSNNFYKSKIRNRINEDNKVSEIKNVNEKKINKTKESLSYDKKTKKIQMINNMYIKKIKYDSRNKIDKLHEEIEKGINNIFRCLTKNIEADPEINKKFSILINNIGDIEKTINIKKKISKIKNV